MRPLIEDILREFLARHRASGRVHLNDLAEVIGSAIALNLLFKLPLMWGVCLTAFDVAYSLLVFPLGIIEILTL